MADIGGNRKIHMNIVTKAVLFPFENLLGIIRLGLLPTLIATAVVYAVYRYTDPINWPPRSVQEIGQLTRSLLPLRVIASLSTIFVGTLVAVGIHRLILRGERLDWTVIRFRKYELAYVSIPLTLLAASYIVPFISRLLGAPDVTGFNGISYLYSGWYVHLAVFIFIVLWLWIYIRLALVFPHAAVTGEISFGKSWTAMKGNFWRFIGAVVLLGIIMIPVSVLFSSMFPALLTLGWKGGGANTGGAFDPIGHMLVLTLLMVPLNGVLLSMFVALISYIYKDLVGPGI